MSVVTVHYSLLGGTEKVAKRLKYSTSHINNFVEGNGKIVIIARRLFKTDDLWALQGFLAKHKRKIVGVIIVDDKSYGTKFGETSTFFSSRGIPIISIEDRVVSNDDISRLEGLIDERI